MSTATLTETPQEIVDWMKKFGFDSQTLKDTELEKSKDLAEKVARLLNEIQRLPNFKDLLKQFGELADAWQWGTDLLEQYKSDHDTTGSLHGQMKIMLKQLDQLKTDIENAKATPPKAKVGDALRRKAGEVTINQSVIFEMVKDGPAEDQLAEKALALRVEEATKTAEELIKDGKNKERCQLALTVLERISKEQGKFVQELNKKKHNVWALNEVGGEVNRLFSQIQSNIEFARKAPLRDDVLVKINECEQRFLQVRGDAIEHFDGSDEPDSKVIERHLVELQKLDEESRGLMSNQARGLQAAGNIPSAQRECDSRFGHGTNNLDQIDTDLKRILGVNKKFDGKTSSGKTITDEISKIRQILTTAKTNAYKGFEKALSEGKGGDDVIVQMRKAFDDAGERIDELRSEVDLVLQDENKVDPVALKLKDIEKEVNHALNAPAIIPDQQDVKKEYDLLKKNIDTAKNNLSSQETLFQLEEIRKRCVAVTEQQEHGVKEGGKDYWKNKEAAQKKLEEAEKEIAKLDPKKNAEQYKAAAAALAEAKLHFRRDDEAAFKKVVDELVPATLEICKLPLTGQDLDLELKFQKERFRVYPMIESARKIDDGKFGVPFDKLVKTKNRDAKDIEELGTLHKAATEVVKQKYKEWEQLLRKASKPAKFVRRLRDLKEDETAPTEQRTELKKRKKEGNELLEKYEEAVKKGDRGDYQKGIKEINEFVDAAEKLEKKFNEQAKLVLESAKDPKDEKGTALTWKGPTAEVKDEDYGFNTNRDAMRYTAGMEMTLDGTLVVSNELDDISKFLDFKFKKFSELCNLGQDPLAIAREVFAPVEENFWPPEAVRVVAVFRAAEQEFEDEELRKEAKELGLTLNPDVEELREQVEAAKKKPLPPNVKEAIQNQMSKEKGKEGLEITTDTLEKTGQLLGLASLWTTTDDYGLEEIGKFQKGSSEGVGYAGGFLEAGVADVLKVGMDINSFANAYSDFKAEKEKKDFKRRKEDEQISPVKKKSLEFERNRAIAKLLNDASDAVLNVISAGGQIPGLNIAGDVKSLVLVAMEAGRYFAMLEKTAASGEGSKNDPDSITYLAFARQAREEKIAGGRKCFEAVAKILKLTGDAVQLAGVAAPAGFAINGAAQALELGGKVVFKVIDWNDASSQNECIKNAKKQPPDYQSIAEVFSNTRKYARFCIAWGCLHDDSWARSWVMSRGLTDSDLDNSQTSTAIIRQYINVTQEGLLGDTQQDDPQTFGQSLPGRAVESIKNLGKTVSDKVNKRNRKLKEQRFDYKVDGLTAASWKTNLGSAKKAGLYESKKTPPFEKLFDAIETAVKAEDEAAKKVPGDDENDDKEYRKLSDDCQRAFDELRNALSSYHPTANPDGKKPHECMKMYLGDLFVELGKQSNALSKRRETYINKSFLKKAGGSEEKAKELKQEELEKAEQERRKQVVEFDKVRSDAVNKRLMENKFVTRYATVIIADQAERDKLQGMVVRQLELLNDDTAAKVLKDLIDETYEDLKYGIWMSLSGLKPEFTNDGKVILPEEEFNKQFTLQFKKSEADFSATLREACTNLVKEKIKGYFNADGKYPTPLDAAGNGMALKKGGPELWKNAVEAASSEKGGWIKDNGADAIGKSIASFAKYWINLHSQLTGNIMHTPTQMKWREKFNTLKSQLESLSCETKYATEHAGMAKLRDRFVKQIGEINTQLLREIRRVSQEVNWQPPDTFFDRWPLRASAHLQVLNLCKARFLDPKSVETKVYTKFYQCGDPRVAWQEVASKPGDFTKEEAKKRFDAYSLALTDLKITADGMKPKYSAKHDRRGQDHDGMMAYKRSVRRRVVAESVAIDKKHKENESKYKTV